MKQKLAKSMAKAIEAAIDGHTDHKDLAAIKSALRDYAVSVELRFKEERGSQGMGEAKEERYQTSRNRMGI